jgi:DEAD/DEAH box helicase domain-containing protein
MGAAEVAAQLAADPAFAAQLTLDVEIPARPPRHAPFPYELEPRLRRALEARGIAQLYTHQAAALAEVRAGRSVVVVTPTASGKTLCYNLPVLDAILRQPNTRALYIFPTKALAQDQLAELHGLITATGADVKTFTYDGDTPPGARTAIRQAGHVVITNPDMLHTGILPHHTRWVKLFANLQYVVLDELHAYRGVFGSHVANVLRRLQRICAFYGAHPQFICCSATIANPRALAERLVESPVALIDDNGAPAGAKRLFFYNPPLVNRELGIRRGATHEARRIATQFLRAGAQTIVFARSRLHVEVLLKNLQDALAHRLGAERTIRGYRGGYLPLQRREIEQGLRAGTVRGVVSTNALELGIDIGQLEVAVLAGYPGTIASTWQQMGRAGRRRGYAVACLVASSNPLDQYVVTHPEYFLGASPEHGLINPDNLLIVAAHLQAAVFELPLASDEGFGAAAVAEILHLLAEDGVVHQSEGRWHWSAEAFPAEGVSLRSASADNVVILDQSQGGRVIGEMDQFSAPVLLHEEAIYLHEGQQYHVDRLDWGEKKAYVHPVTVEYYTDANLSVSIKVLEAAREAAPGTATPGHGEVRLTALATIYKKIRFLTQENVGSGPIHLPEQNLHTTAYWVRLDPALGAGMDREALQSALQGLAHILEQVACVFLMCDPRDLGAYAELRSPHTHAPTVFVYERYPGGVGFAPRLFELHRELLEAARAHIAACTCEAGCPSCVGPAVGAGRGAKAVTLQLLERAREGALAPSGAPAAVR